MRELDGIADAPVDAGVFLCLAKADQAQKK
jgi:hypothetical protein